MKIVKNKETGRRIKVTNEEQPILIGSGEYTHSTKGAFRHQNRQDQKDAVIMKPIVVPLHKALANKAAALLQKQMNKTKDQFRNTVRQSRAEFMSAVSRWFR